jgi:hypothetical protein
MKFRTLLELGRVSNLPTCVSNVAAGWYLSGKDPFAHPAGLLLTTAAILCFYETGMFLNDFFDRRIDQRERPFRPIPSGRISASQVFWIALLLAASGLAITWVSFPSALPVALLLLFGIFAYNLTHSFLAISPLLMGLCRGLIYIFSGYAALGSRPPSSLFLGALVLTAYITGVSTLARRELTGASTVTDPATVTNLAAVTDPAAVTDAPAVTTPFAWHLPRSVASFVEVRKSLSTWRPLPPTIGKLLAGMSVLDALIIFPAGGIQGSLFCILCWGATQLGHRKIAGS